MSPSPGRLADAAYYLATHPTARKALAAVIHDSVPALFAAPAPMDLALALRPHDRTRRALVELGARAITTAYDPEHPESLRATELGERAYPESLRLLTRAGQP